VPGTVKTRDAVVVGAGLAGLTAAVRLAEAGRTVTVVARGIGATHLSPPTIDVLGYAGGQVVERPLEGLDDLPAEHPYRRVGAEAIRDAAAWLGDGYVGSPDENMLLPTAVGASKPSALVPETMAAGDLRAGGRFLFVGFRSLKDFYPALLAENLRRAGFDARAVVLDVVDEPDVNALGLARRFDEAGFRARVARELARHVEAGERVGLPAVLTPAAWQELQEALDASIFEVPTLPPSVGGMRLYDALVARLRAAGGTLLVGGPVVDSEAADGRLDSILVRAAARPTRLRAGAFVLASGGFASGGLELDSDGAVRETVLELPVAGVPEGRVRFQPDLFGEQPLARAGLAVDGALRPLAADGEPVYENVHAAGAVLAGAESWREASGNGIALASGYAAASAILAAP
jgi:glycerol-3-phosphate dehydrogenase subunit B